MNPIIEIQHLSHAYGRKNVLHDIDLAVETGTFFGLLGSNGAGKTTLLKVLAGFLVPKQGSARVLNHDSRNLESSDWTQIGYVSEIQPMYDWLTGEALIAFTSPLYPNWDAAFCQQLCQRLHLPLDCKVRSYSKGERMKMSLLLAMSFHPRLLLLDEPFSGLDVMAKELLITCLLEVTHQEHWSVVLASHDLMEVERLADVIGLINEGRFKVNDPLDVLQARFRRVQVFGEKLFAGRDASMLHLQESENGFTYIETRFSSEREAVLRQQFGSHLEINSLPLREIILALLSTNLATHP